MNDLFTFFFKYLQNNNHISTHETKKIEFQATSQNLYSTPNIIFYCLMYTQAGNCNTGNGFKELPGK